MRVASTRSGESRLVSLALVQRAQPGPNIPAGKDNPFLLSHAVNGSCPAGYSSHANESRGTRAGRE